jgi:hypothetical protein
VELLLGGVPVVALCLSLLFGAHQRCSLLLQI